jgi:hypothetical protein
MTKQNEFFKGLLIIVGVIFFMDYTNDFDMAKDIPIIQDFVPDNYYESDSSGLSSGKKTLFCSSYTMGMCAKYTFTDLDDYEYFKSGKAGGCTYEPAGCKNSGLIGTCDTGSDISSSGSGGKVSSTLYLYSPSFGVTDAKKTCKDLIPSGKWN